MKAKLFHSSLFSRTVYWRSVFTEASVFLFIILFAYAAFSKLIAFRMFSEQLAQSPFISEFSALVAWLIPSIELFVCGLLILPVYRRLGVLSFSILMLSFTMYIALMLTFSSHVPCICGGVISGLTWTQHLIFNAVFLIWGIVLLLKFKKEFRH